MGAGQSSMGSGIEFLAIALVGMSLFYGISVFAGCLTCLCSREETLNFAPEPRAATVGAVLGASSRSEDPEQALQGQNQGADDAISQTHDKATRLLEQLDFVRMELEEHHFVKLETHADIESMGHPAANSAIAGEDGIRHDEVLIQVPLSGVSGLDGNSVTRLNSASCAICLSQYEIGSAIVWSSNTECEHVFHADCAWQWLMKADGNKCPCCRREFIVERVGDETASGKQYYL